MVTSFTSSRAAGTFVYPAGAATSTPPPVPLAATPAPQPRSPASHFLLGRYEVYLEQVGAQPVAFYEAGDSFGELALMYSCERSATVKCVRPGLLWGLDRISYKKIVQQARRARLCACDLQWSPATACSPGQAHAASAHDLEALLKACGPLKDLDGRQIMALTHSIQVLQLERTLAGALSKQRPLAPRLAQNAPTRCILRGVQGCRGLISPPRMAPFVDEFPPSHCRQVVRCSKAQALLKPGAPAEALYVVQSGAMTYAEPGAAARTLRRGDYFGEEALTGLPAEAAAGSSATVTAEEDAMLARITRESFAHYVGALQEIRQAHFNEMALGHCAELAALSSAERRQVCKLMNKVSYPAGATIVKEGGQLTQLHVIHSGEVGEYARGQPAATLSEGSYFGVAALFRHVTAATSHVAHRPTTCMVVSRESVQRQLGPLGAILDREAEVHAHKEAAGRISFASLRQQKILGVGTFGTVKLVLASETSEAYALKCMRKAKVYETGQVEHIISECKLLLECNHPFIVRLVRTFEDAGSLYLLLELTPVGPACTSADPPPPTHPPSITASLPLSPAVRTPGRRALLGVARRKVLPRAAVLLLLGDGRRRLRLPSRSIDRVPRPQARKPAVRC